MKLRWLGPIGLAAALALTACGGGGNSGSGAASDSLSVAADPSGQFAYQPAALSGAAGGLTIEFENEAALPHNLVIVEPGTEDAVVAAAGGDPEGDFPEDTNGVLGRTDTIRDGNDDSVEAELTAGTYTYLCTVPGHYAGGMKGTLTVQ